MTYSFIKNYKSILIISALYVVAQLVVFFAFGVGQCSIQTDSVSYMKCAETISDGSFFEKGASFFRTPGYPLLILLFQSIGQHWIGALMAFQIILSGMALFVLWRIIYDLTQRRKLANLGAILLIFHLNQPFLNMLMMTEALFIPMLVLAFYYFNRWHETKEKKSWLLFALIINLALWVRPVLLILVVLLMAIILIRIALKKMQIYHLIVFSAFFALFSGSWLIRNYLLADTLSYSSVAAINMGVYRKGMVDAAVKDPSFRFYTFNNHPEHDENLRFYDEKYPGFKHMSETERSRIMMKEAWATIGAHPKTYAIAHLKSLVWLAFSSEQYQVNTTLDSLGFSRSTAVTDFKNALKNFDTGKIIQKGSLVGLMLWNYLSRPYNAILWLLFSIAFFLSFKKYSLPQWFAFGLIMYFWLISGPESFLAPRLRMPMEPFIIILLMFSVSRLKLHRAANADVHDDNTDIRNLSSLHSR